MQHFRRARKLGWTLAAVLALGVGSTQLASAQSAAERWKSGDTWELVFGSASANGSYFAGMSAVATLLSAEMDNVRATATVSPQFTQEVYPQMIRNERVGGIASSDLLEAYLGERVWEGRPVPIRGWMRVQEGFYNILVAEEHGMKTIRDLEDSGLRIAAACTPPVEDNPQRWDFAFSFFRAVLAAHGLDAFSDVEVVTYCTAQSIDELQAGNIDGMSQARAIGDASIMELTEVQDLVLLQPDPETLPEIQKSVAVYLKEVPDVYPNLEVPEPGIGFYEGVYAFLHEDLPDDLVYEMTKTVWENIDVLKNSHPGYAGMSLETALEGMPIPVHPGALRYYLEMDVPGAEEMAAKAEDLELASEAEDTGADEAAETDAE